MLKNQCFVVETITSQTKTLRQLMQQLSYPNQPHKQILIKLIHSNHTDIVLKTAIQSGQNQH